MTQLEKVPNDVRKNDSAFVWGNRNELSGLPEDRKRTVIDSLKGQEQYILGELRLLEKAPYTEGGAENLATHVVTFMSLFMIEAEERYRRIHAVGEDEEKSADRAMSIDGMRNYVMLVEGLPGSGKSYIYDLTEKYIRTVLTRFYLEEGIAVNLASYPWDRVEDKLKETNVISPIKGQPYPDQFLRIVANVQRDRVVSGIKQNMAADGSLKHPFVFSMMDKIGGTSARVGKKWKSPRDYGNRLPEQLISGKLWVPIGFDRRYIRPEELCVSSITVVRPPVGIVYDWRRELLPNVSLEDELEPGEYWDIRSKFNDAEWAYFEQLWLQEQFEEAQKVNAMFGLEPFDKIEEWRNAKSGGSVAQVVLIGSHSQRLIRESQELNPEIERMLGKIGAVKSIASGKLTVDEAVETYSGLGIDRVLLNRIQGDIATIGRVTYSSLREVFPELEERGYLQDVFKISRFVRNVPVETILEQTVYDLAVGPLVEKTMGDILEDSRQENPRFHLFNRFREGGLMLLVAHVVNRYGFDFDRVSPELKARIEERAAQIMPRLEKAKEGNPDLVII
jgi:hypothetical protein